MATLHHVGEPAVGRILGLLRINGLPTGAIGFAYGSADGLSEAAVKRLF
jgi:hypothetical protein